MAASSLQPAGTVLLLVHDVPPSGNAHQGSVGPQHLLPSDFLRGSSLPTIPVGQRHCEQDEASWTGNGNTIGALHTRQALLWRHFFLDPTLWWDERQDKKSSRAPDFRHRVSKEVLWLDSVWKPAWVDAQLAALDMQTPCTSNSTLLNDAGYQSVVTAEIASKLCQKGQISEAIDALSVLVRAKSRVSTSLVYSVLKRCVAQKDLALGRRVHDLIVQIGYESNTFLSNHILRMYASQGRLQLARDVFTRVAEPDAFMWSSMISAYAKHGETKRAIQLYHQMRLSNVKPDCHVFVAALQACAGAADLESGRQVHADVLESGIQPKLFVWNCLVDMYAKCGRLVDARMIFDSLVARDVVTWNAMITGYAEHDQGEKALSLHEQMESEGLVVADLVTFACALKACAKVGALKQGKQLHSQILERGLESDVVVGTCLINMYAKCGRFEDARRVFDSLPTKNVVTWNAMIAGCADHGLCHEAFALYARMDQEGSIVADTVTFACILKVCAMAGALQQGKHLHSQIVENGLESDIVVGNSLVDMYAKCGSLDDARKVFESLPTKDVVTWTAMIAGYAEQEHGQEALSLYGVMQQQGIILPNRVTFACLLKACAGLGALAQGKQLHSQILEAGLELDLVIGNCLVDMYAKCGKLEDAHRLFESLPTRDVVTWTAMIAGYAEHEQGQEALSLYKQMEQEGLIVANSFTFACLLKACAGVGAIVQGKQLHSQIRERGLHSNIVVGNCLVDMYAKCGRVEDARRVFDSLPTKDVVTWTLMINAFGQSNEGHKAIDCFQEMLQNGVQATETTFTCLLVACSHEGLVKEGQQFFKEMVEKWGITPTTEHYNCMVDLLGRAGYLDEAERMMVSSKGDDVGVTSLLNACRSHGDIERGTRCFESLMRSDSQSASAYVLMGNLYADAGMWSAVERIERLRKSAGGSKKPAVAGIEVDRHVHTFVVGEARGGTSSKVHSMNIRLKNEGGHLPHTELVLKSVSEKKKEDDLCGHAEKLALAYGLLNTCDGTPLLVTKNLRMCGDCHSSTEIMSRIERREIIVRDAHRVHRFVDGSCRCGGRP